jgi:hypothetical protein
MKKEETTPIGITSENITELKDNQIFVFGSNKRGRHYGGTAKLAVEKFGAIIGVGEGIQGQSYAIPTMGTYEELENALIKFVSYAQQHTDKIFLVTRIGCGIAGKDEERIKTFIQKTFGIDLPSNIWLPKGWDIRLKKSE